MWVNFIYPINLHIWQKKTTWKNFQTVLIEFSRWEGSCSSKWMRNNGQFESPFIFPSRSLAGLNYVEAGQLSIRPIKGISDRVVCMPAATSQWKGGLWLCTVASLRGRGEAGEGPLEGRWGGSNERTRWSLVMRTYIHPHLDQAGIKWVIPGDNLRGAFTGWACPTNTSFQIHYTPSHQPRVLWGWNPQIWFCRWQCPAPRHAGIHWPL